MKEVIADLEQQTRKVRRRGHVARDADIAQALQEQEGLKSDCPTLDAVALEAAAVNDRVKAAEKRAASAEAEKKEATIARHAAEQKLIVAEAMRRDAEERASKYGKELVARSAEAAERRKEVLAGRMRIEADTAAMAMTDIYLAEQELSAIIYRIRLNDMHMMIAASGAPAKTAIFEDDLALAHEELRMLKSTMSSISML